MHYRRTLWSFTSNTCICIVSLLLLANSLLIPFYNVMDKLPMLNSNASAGNSSVLLRSFLEDGGHAYLESQELRVLIPAILGVVCVLGFVCNITAMGVLVANARKGKLSLINSLILNLTLADGLVLAFAVPFKAAAYSRASWTLGWLVCKTCDWFLHSCMSAKSFTVAVMAKACFRYVSNPTKQVAIQYRTILAILLLCWGLACVLPAPLWLFAALRREGSSLWCVQAVPPSARDFMAVYVKVYPLLAYCGPLSVALLYFWRAYGRCQRRGTKTQNLRTQIRSRRLTVMLLSLTLTSATLWLPEWVSWVWSRHAAAAAPNKGPPPPPLLFVLCAQVLMLSISLVNPLVVLSMSEEFREGYLGLWRRLTLQKHQPTSKTQGPHAATAPRPPSPRPEGPAHSPAPPMEDPDAAVEMQEERESGKGSDSPGNKDGIHLPDLEQFWHEREAGSSNQENDPVPWEHQDPAEVKAKS
ncbi:G-protein coupled receptor 151 [Amia ocellicauda]|uniref:G-protein coupled receptor 151 n=1 Tax=Amia ocellicauda TaxID=2972642 RepID=UPI003464835E